MDNISALTKCSNKQKLMILAGLKIQITPSRRLNTIGCFVFALETIRMLIFIYLLLCLILMSDDANDEVGETLHVRQNIGTVLQNFSYNDRIPEVDHVWQRVGHSGM